MSDTPSKERTRNEGETDLLSNIPQSTLPDEDPLTSDYFEGQCIDLAESLVGKLLLHRTSEGVTGGIITETEAYLGKDDPSCHLSSGRTDRNTPFYSGKGTIYVFKIYRHHNLNIITEYGSYPECILIRALEPAVGIELMQERRGREALDELTTGPGKLTEALGIKKERINNTPLEGSNLEIYDTDVTDFSVSRSDRIGISEAEEWPLRFCMEESEFISKPISTSPSHSFDREEYYSGRSTVQNKTLSESIN